MPQNHHSDLLREYLELLCGEHPHAPRLSWSEWCRTRLATPTLGLMLALSGCEADSDANAEGDGGMAGVVDSGGGEGFGGWATISSGGTAGTEFGQGGMVTLYGIVYDPEDCTNGVDDGTNGLVDCDDPVCVEHPSCTSVGAGGTLGAGGAVSSGGSVGVGGSVTQGGSGSGGGTTTTERGGAAGLGGKSASEGGATASAQGGSEELGGAQGIGGIGVAYGIPYETDCTDEQDNDWDGLTDCDDTDCTGTPSCLGAGGATGAGGASGVAGEAGSAGDAGFGGSIVVEYGVFMESDCTDELDNDGDEAVDCADSDCVNDDACQSGVLYGVAMQETDCADGLDDDADNAVDCEDTDCATASVCSVATDYGIAMAEDCQNGDDDDLDGATDCADADCAGTVECGGERYGIVIGTGGESG